MRRFSKEGGSNLPSSVLGMQSLDFAIMMGCDKSYRGYLIYVFQELLG